MSEVPFDDSEVEFMDCVCPFCGGHLSLPVTSAGEPTECPQCVQVLIAPADPVQPAKKFPLPLASKRLIIRRLRPEDDTDLYELVQDDDAMRYIDFPALELADVKEWIARDARVRFFIGEGNLDLAVELASENRLIGWITLGYSEAHPLPTGAPGHSGMYLQLVLHPKLWKQGFGLEAVTAMKDFVFNQLGSRRLTASCDTRNDAARALLKKAGLREEGLAYQAEFVKSEWVDEVSFAMLKAEFTG